MVPSSDTECYKSLHDLPKSSHLEEVAPVCGGPAATRPGRSFWVQHAVGRLALQGESHSKGQHAFHHNSLEQGLAASSLINSSALFRHVSL